MSFLIKVTSVYFISMLSLLAKVYADDVTINISGNVKSASCTVNPVVAQGLEVDLGKVNRSSLSNPGSSGNWKSFKLELTNCPSSITTSTATFTGSTDINDPSLFANTEPTLTAAGNVAIQMAEDNNYTNVISNNGILTVSINSLSHSVTFPLAARMYAPIGNVISGKISSSIVVNFIYQ